MVVLEAEEEEAWEFLEADLVMEGEEDFKDTAIFVGSKGIG